MILWHRFGLRSSSIYAKPPTFNGLENVIGYADIATCIKTHEIYSDQYARLRAIYVQRDSSDVLESFAAYRQHVDVPQEMVLRWGDPEQHAHGWTSHPNCLRMQFSDLGSDTTITRIANFLGIDPKPGRVPTFAELHEMDPLFFRKGQIARIE
jgi:hypothetical protein